MDKIIAKNITENLNGKCCQKLVDHANQFAMDALTSNKAIHKTAEATGNLIANKTSNVR